MRDTGAIPRATERRNNRLSDSTPRRPAGPRPKPNRFYAHGADDDEQVTLLEMEFGRAMDRYQQRTGRRNPGAGEIIRVLTELSYVRPGRPDLVRDGVQFAQRLRQYREESGRQFPLWSEILGVARRMGFRKEIFLFPLPVPTMVAMAAS